MDIVFDSYFEYNFECNEFCFKEDSKKANNQIKAFNGGGSGG